MREFFAILKKADLQRLFLVPTQNAFLQFFRYVFVGGIASVVDWGVLWALEEVGLHYLVAAVFGFFAGLVTNFVLSKKLVFQAEDARVGTGGEFVAYTLIGSVGLGLTLGLMYVMTDLMGLHFMLSKIIATALVLIWNFLARKLILYRHTQKQDDAL